MEEQSLNNLLNIALKAAIEAGEEILKIYRQDFDIEFKEDYSPLTTADKNANEIINSYLLKTGIPIISEENKQTDYAIRKKWNSCWIVDPLDGTKEFIKKNDEFTVNIALVKNQKPILGVIYVPVSKELFIGNVHDKKSYKTHPELASQPHPKLVSQPLKPTKKATINPSPTLRVIGSRSHMNQETTDFINALKKQNNQVAIVSKGSSLKFCLLAEGKADIYPRFAPTMEWDTAAGHAICNAVGISIINNETNRELLYNKKNLLNPWFIAGDTF